MLRHRLSSKRFNNGTNSELMNNPREEQAPTGN
jgi:hypothetical protein